MLLYSPQSKCGREILYRKSSLSLYVDDTMKCDLFSLSLSNKKVNFCFKLFLENFVENVKCRRLVWYGRKKAIFHELWWLQLFALWRIPVTQHTYTHTQVYKYNRATREKSGWCRVTSSRMKSRSDTPPCIFSETYLSLKLFLARF